MARTDNIWSQCFIFAVATLIKELAHQGCHFGVADIYFDPKGLKHDHVQALQTTVRGLIVRLAKEYTSERGFGLLEDLSIRLIEPVEKAVGGGALHPLQWGTLVADKLCSSSDKMVDKSSRIIGCDMSDVIRRTSQQFDGKSFYDN